MKNENSSSLVPNNSGMREKTMRRISKSITTSACILFLGLPVLGADQVQSKISTNVSVVQSEFPMARINGNNQLYIRGAEVQKTYKISVSHLGFNNLDEARDYFGALNIEYIVFEAESKDYVLMNLDVSQVGNWTVSDWNGHFAQSVN